MQQVQEACLAAHRLLQRGGHLAGTGGRRPSPRENFGRLDAGSLSGSCPKYAMACVIAPLMAGSIFAQMNQQIRTRMPSWTHTAEVASRPASTRTRIIAVPMTLWVR